MSTPGPSRGAELSCSRAMFPQAGCAAWEGDGHRQKKHPRGHRGDQPPLWPMTPLETSVSGVKWTRRTTNKVADELASAGIEVCANTVAKLLKGLG